MSYPMLATASSYGNNYNAYNAPFTYYPPTQHYQQDYNCYEQTPIYFPTMPNYGYASNPDIPCPPQMSVAPKPPNYPMPMPMPGLPPQIRPFGCPQPPTCPPAPTFTAMTPPNAPPQPPAFYCPPKQPACRDYPTA